MRCRVTSVPDALSKAYVLMAKHIGLGRQVLQDTSPSKALGIGLIGPNAVWCIGFRMHQAARKTATQSSFSGSGLLCLKL